MVIQNLPPVFLEMLIMGILNPTIAWWLSFNPFEKIWFSQIGSWNPKDRSENEQNILETTWIVFGQDPKFFNQFLTAKLWETKKNPLIPNLSQRGIRRTHRKKRKHIVLWEVMKFCKSNSFWGLFADLSVRWAYRFLASRSMCFVLRKGALSSNFGCFTRVQRDLIEYMVDPPMPQCSLKENGAKLAHNFSCAGMRWPWPLMNLYLRNLSYTWGSDTQIPKDQPVAGPKRTTLTA